MTIDNYNSTKVINPQPPLSNPYANALPQTALSASQEQSLVTYNHLTYALYALSFFTVGLTWVIPLIMNYAKRNEARGTWLYSHFDWQLKTFWYSIFVVVLSWILMWFGFGGLILGIFLDHAPTMAGSGMMGGIGVLLFLVAWVWHFYRLVRGWIALASRRAVG